MNARVYAPRTAEIRAVRLSEGLRYPIQRWIAEHGADARATGEGIVVATPARMFLVAWGEWVVMGPAGLDGMSDDDFRATYREA